MSDEESAPFFWNTKRLQRAESYFDIGRSRENLCQILLEDSNTSDTYSTIDAGENTSVQYYGVNRYICVESAREEDGISSSEFIEVDEDVQFQNTSGFALFWMTFKRIALSVGEQFSGSKLARSLQREPGSDNGQGSFPTEELTSIVVNPSTRDSRISQSRIIYGDANYLIQKFRVGLPSGSLDIGLFSVEFPSSQAETFHMTDLQAYVVSPDCGSYVWVENGKASAIFLAKSSADFLGNVMIWFRKILSDMTLADSVMIGHPYYWHAPVRRRLTKVMKYLKRLYVKLSLKEKEKQQSGSTNNGRPFINKGIELIYPDKISKVVIREKPTYGNNQEYTTYEKMNTMLDQLVKKWSEYQRNLRISPRSTVESISHTWRENNPRATENAERPFLESVTFLEFQNSTERLCLKDSIPDINDNIITLDKLESEEVPLSGATSQASCCVANVKNEISLHPADSIDSFCEEFCSDHSRSSLIPGSNESMVTASSDHADEARNMNL